MKLKDRLKNFYSYVKSRGIYFIYDIRDYIVDGFPRTDIWSLDYTLSYWIIPRLKKLKETKNGFPVMMYNDDEFKNCTNGEQNSEIDARKQKEWEEILDKMILSFEYVVRESDDRNYDCYSSKEKMDEHEQKIQEGLDLFAKYFRCLWD